MKITDEEIEKMETVIKFIKSNSFRNYPTKGIISLDDFNKQGDDRILSLIRHYEIISELRDEHKSDSVGEGKSIIYKVELSKKAHDIVLLKGGLKAYIKKFENTKLWNTAKLKLGVVGSLVGIIGGILGILSFLFQIHNNQSTQDQIKVLQDKMNVQQVPLKH
jgi:hypothetical protein